MSSMAFDLPSDVGGDAVLVTRSFADLSTKVQQLGQWENSGDITPEVLLQAINFALIEGYDIITGKWLDYYTIEATFPFETNEPRYTLSTVAPGFYKLRHLAYTRDTTVTANSRFVPMLPHAIEGAASYSGVSASAGRPPRYRVQGRDLVFAPMPSGGTVKVYYIPVPPQFASVTDDLQVIFEVPIEERLIVQLAQREILERNDLSTADCDRKIDRLTGMLRVGADSRDAGEPLYLSPHGPPRESWMAFDGDEL